MADDENYEVCITQLVEMFPNIDEDLIQAVMVSNGKELQLLLLLWIGLCADVVMCVELNVNRSIMNLLEMGAESE